MANRIFTLIFAVILYLPSSAFAVADNEQCKEYSKARRSAQRQARTDDRAVKRFERKIVRYTRKIHYEEKKKAHIESDPRVSFLNRRIEEATIKCAAGSIGGIFGIGNIFGGNTGKACNDALFRLKQQKQLRILRNKDKIEKLKERINTVRLDLNLAQFDLTQAQATFAQSQALFVNADNTYVTQGCGTSIIVIPTPTPTPTA